MSNKLSFVLNNKFYTKSDVKIQDSESSYNYVLRVIKQIEEIHSSKLQMILFQQDNLVIYGYELDEKPGSVITELWSLSLEGLKTLSATPNFLEMHFENSINCDYGEIELLMCHPEMYKFIPLKNEANVRDLFNFIINDLNVNFHPDDNFEDYLLGDRLTDEKGNKIYFYKYHLLMN